MFGGVPELPPDAIFHINTRYNADEDARKLNLGIGAYRTEEGHPLVLDAVIKAEKEILAQLQGADAKQKKEYLPIGGLADFCASTVKLICGDDCAALAEGRVTTVQSLSGTGALRLIADFLCSVYPDSTVYLSDPTWSNHATIQKLAGIKSAKYPYFDKETLGLDFEGMMGALMEMPPKSIVMLHACAHNPTGVDPTPEQWKAFSEVMLARGLIPIFDCAYQGYASGDLAKDAWAVRYFIDQGHECMIAQSYSKNFGLYNDRIGAVNVVCRTPAAATAVRA